MAVISMTKFRICLQKTLVARKSFPSAYVHCESISHIFTPKFKHTSRISRLISISIDEAKAGKASSCFQYG